MGKQTICICENKDADQFRGNREADQRLCFRYTDSTLPLLFKSESSRFQPASVTLQPDLCRTCSEITFLVFPRGGSIILTVFYNNNEILNFEDIFFFTSINIFLREYLCLRSEVPAPRLVNGRNCPIWNIWSELSKVRIVQGTKPGIQIKCNVQLRILYSLNR